MSEGVTARRDMVVSKGETLAAVAAGGAIGSLGRWGAGLLAPGAVWPTLLVNVTGALAMGLLVAWLAAGERHPLVRPAVSVGLLGGWTTYSSFALDAHGLAGDGLGDLLAYLVLTLGLGLGAALLGLVIGDRLWHASPSADEGVAEEEL